MANNYRVPKPETVGLIVSGLKTFYGDVYSTIAKSVSSGFETYLFTPRMTKSDFDFVLEKIFGRGYAIERVVQEYVRDWLEYYAGATEGVAPPEAPSATIPENLDELVAQFEENQKSTEPALQKEQNKKDFLRRIQELSEENLKENIEPIKTTETPPPETPTAEAFQEGELAVQVNPLSKPTVFTPGHYSVNAGITAISETNPQAATATFFLSQGISPQVFQETADKKPLTSPQKKSVEGFVKTMKEIQRSSPVLRKLIIRRSPEIRTFNIFANIGELQQAGISQGEIIRLASSNIDMGGTSVPTFSAPQGFLKRWAGNIGGQLFPAIFRRGPERALTRAGIKLFGKTGGRVVQKVAGKAILSKAGALLGPEGWIASEIIVRVGSWAKKFLSEHKELIAGVLVGGLAIVGGAPLIAAALLGTAAGLGTAFATGGSAAFSSAAGSLASIPGFILSSLLLPSLAGPLLFALIGIPVLIALILFIINSGAFIVPPKLTTLGAIESPYVKVEKVANPEGPFENGNLPLTIEYIVTVSAKKGTLTNIFFENVCRVTKDGTPPPCDAPVPEKTPESISPTKAFVFTYTKTFAAGFEDSFVTDIFTVTADAPEQKGAVAATSAVIKIGEPPEECPAIWPTDSGYITQGAYSPSGFSHSSMEAIDIGTNLRPVFAGHSGTVTTSQRSSCIGNYIEVASSCEGKEFISRYAHLEGVSVKSGQEVTMNQTIGLSGDTGSCTTGPHLHYQFKYTSGGSPSFPNNPPFMMKPYIPSNIPRGCSNSGSCGVSI